MLGSSSSSLFDLMLVHTKTMYHKKGFNVNEDYFSLHTRIFTPTVPAINAVIKTVIARY
jgi:hypothetical protein